MRRARRCVTALAVATAAVLLGGCGTGSTPHTQAAVDSPGFGVNAHGTVHFWTRSATEAVAKKMAAEFNVTHPHLKVVVSAIQEGQAVTKLATALRAGEPPDLIGLNNVNMPIFTRRHQFVDLTRRIAELPYHKSLSKGHLRLATYRGRRYGVPYLADVSVLWYNKALFRKAGLDPNRPPTDFASILRDARAVEGLGHGVHGFSFAGNCGSCLGFTMLPSVWAGGSHVIGGPVGKQHGNIAGNRPLSRILRLYRTLWREGLVPPSDRTEDGTTWGNDFLSGKVGIFPAGYGIVQQKLAKSAVPRSDIGVAPLPGPDGNYSTFDGGDDFAIPVGANNPSGAWEFVKFVLQRRHQLQYPGLGFTPVRSDVLTPAFARRHPFDAVAVRGMARGYAPETQGYNAVFNQPNGAWFGLFQQAVYGEGVRGALRAGQTEFAHELELAGS